MLKIFKVSVSVLLIGSLTYVSIDLYDSNNKVEELELNIEKLNDEHDNEVEELSNEIINQEKSNKKLKSNNKKIKNNNKKLKSNNKKLKDKIDGLDKKIDNLSDEIDDLESKNKKLSSEKVATTDTVSTSKKTTKTKKEKVDKSQKQNSSNDEGGYKNWEQMKVEATAYTSNCNGCSGITYTGIDLKANPNAKVVAVDPSIIPLGSKVYVEGYGEAIAGDTGGAIKGNRIDVFIDSKEDVREFGRKNIDIYVKEM